MYLKIALVLMLAGLFFYTIQRMFARPWKKPEGSIPSKWKAILKKEVPFYRKLNKKERELFHYKVLEFTHNCKIIGVETTITDLDKVLVAASAIIPIFAFPEWKYKNLEEVLIYPDTFNLDFETKGNNRQILGMVGTGYMEDKMILSKNALRKGFKNETDKKNTAIHEFVHLIDKMDGAVDGIPSVLLEKQYVIPWMDMIERKLEEIVKNKSDINPYATTGREEFFAVLSEYFFERPLLLKKKHPELYEMLEEIFEQDLVGLHKGYLKKN
ncbi:MAG: zinc-dependent peptidase [Saprospiraceae bacterium]